MEGPRQRLPATVRASGLLAKAAARLVEAQQPGECASIVRYDDETVRVFDTHLNTSATNASWRGRQHDLCRRPRRSRGARLLAYLPSALITWPSTLIEMAAGPPSSFADPVPA